MEIKENNILFFIGAGCSKEAGIPISNEMVKDVENSITTDDDFKKYKDLYYYLKSSINYSEGIFGKFNDPFNIEKLMIVIRELEKRDRNIMYPFIGTWNSRLVDLGGQNFTNLSDFSKAIIRKLNNWVKPNDYAKADYYNGFLNFASEIGKSIKIFSLNYDLCIERVIGADNIELGFNSKTKEWHYSNFEDINKPLCLYKLHGSIDWYKKNNKLLISHDPVDDPELIFGTDNKLKSIDPYLFYTYEFRKYSLDIDCKLLVIIGYSFSDSYLNGIISQALVDDTDRNILVVLREKSNEQLSTEKKRILDILGLSSDEQLKILECKGASDFLQNYLSKDQISKYIKSENIF
jgi:hypothetical protein